jgi:RNA polymerase sigma factor (sigma-70 family)
MLLNALESAATVGFVGSIQRLLEETVAKLVRRWHDEELCEETAWECVLAAYDCLQRDERFFVSRNVEKWIYRRASWRLVDHLRRRGRSSSLALAGKSEGYYTVDLPETDEPTQRRGATIECLELLDPQERLILERHYFKGETDQEIGDHIYGEEGTVAARGLRVWRRRQKAHEKLKELLQTHGIADK